MGQYVLLHRSPNSKLHALLCGNFCCKLFTFESPDHFLSLSQSFFECETVYIRFSHIASFQPKFYIGPTSSFVLDREHSRFRKFLQVRQNKYVLAEVALRFWNHFDNFWLWSVIPVFTGKSNFWALEQALIQLWQPKLNAPFIFEFFNCPKSLIPKQPFSSTRQFGTFSLWRKLRWRTTPHRVRAALRSKTFFDRVTLWSIIQDLGANSLRRFQMEKHIRSNSFGLQGCYFIRRLAANLGEPQRSYSLQAIDRAIKFWKGPAVRCRLPLRAPWLLDPCWRQTLQRHLTSHTRELQPHNVTLQLPSTWIVFTKYPSVMDSLCNHKEAANEWAEQQTPTCVCSTLSKYAGQQTNQFEHVVLEGETVSLPPEPSSLRSIAQGSLSNKIFPPSKEIHPYSCPAWTLGPADMAFHPSHAATHSTCGANLCPSTQLHLLTMSPTKASSNFALSSAKRSSTTKTRKLPHSVFTAHASTPLALQTPLPTSTFFDQSPQILQV